MTIQEQVEFHGYNFEEHKIQTEDGYILTAFRVPSKKGEKIGNQKTPIFMQHGLIDDGGTWFYNNETLDLSLELVDLGYDIWVTNSRGTVYSNEHVNLTVNDKEYWDFTYHEMGKYDVPANLQYIFNVTGANQVVYFGHSQGTTQWFIANALNPEISQYFKAFIGIAPVAHVTNEKSVMVKTLDLLEIPDLAYEYLWDLGYIPAVSTYAAPFLHYFPRFVWNFIETVVGFDKTYHIDLGSLPMMGRNDVGGTSTKDLLHWTQNIRSGNFAEFDYGSDMNKQVYNSSYPPNYNMDQFKTTLAHVEVLLFCGQNDALVAPDDLKILQNALPVSAQTISVEDYNHLDQFLSNIVRYLTPQGSYEFILITCGQLMLMRRLTNTLSIFSLTFKLRNQLWNENTPLSEEFLQKIQKKDDFLDKSYYHI